MFDRLDVLIAVTVNVFTRQFSKGEPPDTLIEKDAMGTATKLSVPTAVQPIASVTVTVLPPTGRPAAVEPLEVGVTVPGVGDHETVKPVEVEPPLTTAVAVEMELVQLACVEVSAMEGCDSAASVTTAVEVLQAASFTVTV